MPGVRKVTRFFFVGLGIRGKGNYQERGQVFSAEIWILLLLTTVSVYLDYHIFLDNFFTPNNHKSQLPSNFAIEQEDVSNFH